MGAGAWLHRIRLGEDSTLELKRVLMLDDMELRLTIYVAVMPEQATSAGSVP